ncbi:hypothetical protein N780_04400 [Pontibacillus chungwhensis BH030062]|uniref:DUF4367 domain-containing protein n=1 Tax=Pontibacillus chungwhensis BH030062 TaxID=1385513 RepID=A0A0A2URV3_9BACI|nr:hypothetical protein [Pontibacillus chungwhensis]KGP90669.1 hypothetical protein N780_04400 [Pontibacillus chungwhensis BH030062]
MRVGTGFLFMIFMLLLSACSSQSSGVTASFNKQVTEELRTDVFIPEYKEYPITSAQIVSVPTGDAKDLAVVYSKNKGTLMDEEYIDVYEKDMGSNVVYGLYDGEPWLFRITYSNVKTTISTDDIDIKNINGVDVQFSERKVKDDEIVLTFFNVEEGSYSIEFVLREGLTKDKAFEIAESIIKNTTQG